METFLIILLIWLVFGITCHIVSRFIDDLHPLFQKVLLSLGIVFICAFTNWIAWQWKPILIIGLGLLIIYLCKNLYAGIVATFTLVFLVYECSGGFEIGNTTGDWIVTNGLWWVYLIISSAITLYLIGKILTEKD